MQNRIERLAEQLSELQLRQTANIEELQALGGTSTVGLRTKTSNNSENQDTATKGVIEAPTSNSEHNTSLPIANTTTILLIASTILSGIATIDTIHEYLSTIEYTCWQKENFRSRIGKVVQIDCDTKWVPIELDNSKQITTRKSKNIRIEPRR